MASKYKGTLYVGVTSDIAKRVYEHKSNLIDGFTKKYGVHTLVYLEESNDVNAALEREKRLKKWSRQWKINLINESNPS